MNLRLLSTILLLCTLSGCASLQKSIEGYRQRASQKEQLGRAIDLMVRGDTRHATAILQSITAGRGTPGITDEALFRLAVLSLPDDLDPEDMQRVSRPLERLKKEYPASSWTAQAAPLAEFVATIPGRIQTASELRRQLKSLRELNLSLTRENKELRLNIEKLKTLDLEIERKNKP
ncbi:lipoprotein [Geotalea uraniireducens]|uniref:Lipoprotein n=1 Tax=Geotalea uraniireducens TaxID=351604 RepID=A0ABN6VRX2_9BACT|nr:tetratricopeptide repeat protein [Geotalea uraniireducens]BDV43075.1 lipoprotein [Geotalea uraniireducens]